MKKEIKEIQKNEFTKQIKNDRILLKQDLGWLFRPLALCPFPSRPLPKREIKVKGKFIEEYGILWERKAGNMTVEILGHPKYGVPYGQDTLIILFLAMEARKQNTRKIRVNFYRDFCRMFGITSTGGSRYNNIVKSLNRIRYSQYTWSDKNDPTRQKGVHYIYIEELDLYCDPKNPKQKPLFDQYILLSERFWDEINKHKIPFNLEAIKYLKGKPGHLNFYIWLSYRVGINYLKNQSAEGIFEDFIPFWGKNGLVDQLSTQIIERFSVRKELKKWLKQTKELWPECPVEINGDALIVKCTDKKQLDVQLDQQIEAGREIRKEIEEEKQKQKFCTCGGTLKSCRGKKQGDGTRLDDYYHCFDCGENYGKNKFPELF